MFSSLALLTPDPSHRHLVRWGLLAIALTLGGCAATDTEVPAPVVEEQTGGWTACESPRPKICTMEYAPVCARLDGENTRTYPSRCNACADIAVSDWRSTPCEES